jgi:NADH-quinone oxidoreductase subunit J
MTISPVLFWLFATVSVIASILMITVKNPVRAALFLVTTFICVAAFYILLSAQFIAAVQIIVYAGAIMVLFLFVIMLLNIGAPEALNEKGGIQPQVAVVLGAIFILALLGSSSLITLNTLPVQYNERAIPPVVPPGTVQDIGLSLYNPASPWLFPFEITSILLLVAVVGAIILAKRKI